MGGYLQPPKDRGCATYLDFSSKKRFAQYGPLTPLPPSRKLPLKMAIFAPRLTLNLTALTLNVTPNIAEAGWCGTGSVLMLGGGRAGEKLSALTTVRAGGKRVKRAAVCIFACFVRRPNRVWKLAPPHSDDHVVRGRYCRCIFGWLIPAFELLIARFL